ncbi:MAG: sigma-70 family RNA polymerase sigma factor [Ginsengibacter sp.]
MTAKDELLKLVEECRANRPRAQEKLFRQFYGFAIQTALRYCNNEEDAADILSISFTKIFRHIDSFDSEKGQLHGWIKRIVINQAIDHIKAMGKFKETYPIEKTDTYILENAAIEKLTAAELLIIIQELSPVRRTVFNLYAVEGFNHREINELTGLNENTSKWHLTEAKKQLQMKILNRKIL